MSVNLKVVEPVLVMQFIIRISNLLFSFIRLIIFFSSYYLFIFFIFPEAEPIIRKALVIGNFSAAVDCCLEAGLMAEALLLAQVRGERL